MYNNKLLGFLLNDITDLIEDIERNDELAFAELQFSSFERLSDFASYWRQHLKELQEQHETNLLTNN